MKKETIPLVIIGHLNHGKSTLIGRLLLNTNSLSKDRLTGIQNTAKGRGEKPELAFLIDQLEEERLQKRTIETTQARLRTAQRDYILIDAPGHTEFLKNMLTGASMSDAAVLVIDAHEGLQEQTRRHTYLIKLLGIKEILVAVNKMDLVGYRHSRFVRIQTELCNFLHEVKITPSCIIPLSAKTDENISRASSRMPWYTGPFLLQALHRLPYDARPRERPLRFCVQNIFPLGNTDIALGKVVSGVIKTGQKVIRMPSFKKTKIHAIKIFGNTRKQARQGENIGVCLGDPRGMQRGEIIVAEKNPPLPVCRFTTTVFWISPVPLRLHQKYTIRLLTQESDGVAEKIEKRTDSNTLKIIEENARKLNKHEVAQVTVRTKKPLIIEDFSYIEELGRLIIERENRVCGVGVIRR